MSRVSVGRALVLRPNQEVCFGTCIARLSCQLVSRELSSEGDGVETAVLENFNRFVVLQQCFSELMKEYFLFLYSPLRH